MYNESSSRIKTFSNMLPALYETIATKFVRAKDKSFQNFQMSYAIIHDNTSLNISTNMGLKFCLWSTYSNETLNAKLDELELLISGAAEDFKNFNFTKISALSTAIAPYDCFTNLSLLNFDNDKDKPTTIKALR